MARIRSIHPGVYTDEAWASVSIPARWFAKGLCTEADDNGVFEWKPLQLKMRIFPADTIDVPALLVELVEAGIVLAFEAEGRKLGAIRNFCRYQRPRKPKAWFPVTEAAKAFAAVGSAGASDEHDEPPAPPVPQKSEPVPQKSEMSPQREDEGGRREEEDISEPNGSSISPSRAVKARDTIAFEVFWSAYPRKVAKGGARKQFDLAIKRGVTLDELIAAVARDVARQWVDRPPDKIPHATTWLNQSRWLDEPEPIQTPALRPHHDQHRTPPISKQAANLERALAGFDLAVGAGTFDG